MIIFFENWEFFKYFDGKVVSGHCKLLKPEKEIYELLCSTYSLKPNECVFIDDTKANIEAAEKFGINGIHLTDINILEDKISNKSNISIIGRKHNINLKLRFNLFMNMRANSV